MRVLICSDSHMRLDYFQKIIDKELPDTIIFAGDHSADALNLQLVYKNINFFIVRGNTDFQDYETKDIILFEIEKKKVMLTHGHLFGVKQSLSELKKEAVRNQVDICIFGHTHVSHKEKENGILYLNPGALRDGKYIILEKHKLSMKEL